jgi:hypothetical protein
VWLILRPEPAGAAPAIQNLAPLADRARQKESVPFSVPLKLLFWWWIAAAPELRGNDFLEVKLGRDGMCHVSVSKFVKHLEKAAWEQILQ